MPKVRRATRIKVLRFSPEWYDLNVAVPACQLLCNTRLSLYLARHLSDVRSILVSGTFHARSHRYRQG